jgi:hypothetical protein
MLATAMTPTFLETISPFLKIAMQSRPVPNGRLEAPQAGASDLLFRWWRGKAGSNRQESLSTEKNLWQGYLHGNTRDFKNSQTRLQDFGSSRSRSRPLSNRIRGPRAPGICGTAVADQQLRCGECPAVMAFRLERNLLPDVSRGTGRRHLYLLGFASHS